MRNFRRFTLALTLAAIAALAVLGAVVWADDGPPAPNHGMHALGTITAVNAADKTFSIRSLIGRDPQTFYTDDNTKVFMLTKPDATVGDLAVGMVVEVEAHHDSATSHAVADRVNVVPPPPAAMGKVKSVDATNKSFELLMGRSSRTINTNADTVFRGPGNAAATFADIKVGDMVEVWSAAHTNAGDAAAPILATVVMIQRHAPPPPPPPTNRPFSEEGKIADLNKDAKTFTLVVTPRSGNEKKFAVKYTDNTVIMPPTADPHGLLDGMRVRVIGTVTPSSSTSTPATVNARVIVVLPAHDDEP